MQQRVARAEPATLVKRYVVCFGCLSMAVILGGANGMGGEPHVLASFAPSASGFGYDLTPPLASRRFSGTKPTSVGEQDSNAVCNGATSPISSWRRP